MREKEIKEKFSFFKNENGNNNKKLKFLCNVLFVFFLIQTATVWDGLINIAQYNQNKRYNFESTFNDYTMLTNAIKESNQNDIITYYVRLNSNNNILSDVISLNMTTNQYFELDDKYNSKNNISKNTQEKMKKIRDQFLHSGYYKEKNRTEDLKTCTLFLKYSAGCQLQKYIVSENFKQIENVHLRLKERYQIEILNTKGIK